MMCRGLKRIGAALAASASGITGEAVAQTPAACLGLDDAVFLSIQSSPAVARAEADRDGARAGVAEARALRRPQLSAFVSTESGDAGLTGAAISNQVGLRASQRIYDFGASRLERDAADANLDARRIAVASAEIQAGLDTALTLVSLLEIKARLEITAEREDFFQRQLVATEAVLDAGGATRADLAEVAARVEEAAGDRLELRFERDRLSTQLATDTGGPATPCALSQGLLAPPEEGMVTLADRALSANPDLASLRADRRRLAARTEQARRKRLPVIELVGIASYASDNELSDWRYRDRIGVDVSVPLLSGGALNADRQRRAAELAGTRSDLALARRDIAEAVEVSYRRILSLSAQVARRQAVAERKAEQFDAARVEFDAGLRTLPDLIEDRLELEEARITAAAVRFELARESLRLQALTGDLGNGPGEAVASRAGEP